jgi:hypothetical protein
MARFVANVDIITETFELWLLKTNTLLDALSKEIITANATVANTGNTAFPRSAQLYGKFGSNTVVATDELRGGNTTGGYDVLTITTNTVLSNSSVTTINFRIGNTTINSVSNSSSLLISNSIHSTLATEGFVRVGNTTVNTVANSSSVLISNSINSTLATEGFVRTGNSVVNTVANSSSVLISNSIHSTLATEGLIRTGNSVVNTVANSSSILISNSIHSTLATEGLIRTGNATINTIANSTIIKIANSISSANIDAISFKTGISTVNTIAISVGSNVVVTATNLTTGNSTVNTAISQSKIHTDGFLRVLGNTALSNTLAVTGTTTLSNTLSVGGISTFKTEYVLDVSANADLGSTTGTPVLAYVFAKATYSSGKFEVQVKNGANTQLSEMVLAHNSTDSYVTVYGTVSSPPASSSANSLLGTFTANINNANVELLIIQSVANSAVKIVAHLIK